MEYQALTIETIYFEVEDVIQTSGVLDHGTIIEEN